jgi:ABC-type transporter Mla MlaB component
MSHDTTVVAGGADGSFELRVAGDDKLAARGPLTFANARLAHEQGLRALAAAPGRKLEVDCGGLTVSDSAGLAVLLDWLGAVHRAGGTLRCTQLPRGLVALSRMSEVEALLERGG